MESKRDVRTIGGKEEGGEVEVEEGGGEEEDEVMYLVSVQCL